MGGRRFVSVWAAFLIAVSEGELNVESVAPVDDDMSAVYQYLIGSSGGSA